MAGWQAAVAVVASVAGGAAVLWPILVELEVRKCERPKYAVLRSLSLAGAAAGSNKRPVELRRYAPILVAEAPVDAADMKEAGGQGFRRLAGFIFGKNTAAGAAATGGGGGGGSEKVAMTSPVIMEMAPPSSSSSQKVAMTSPVIMEMAGGGEGGGGGGGGGRVRATMAFTMPSKYSRDTLPVPLDSQVRVREVPARTVATLRFRGQVRSKAAYERPAARLRAALAAAGVKVKGPLEVYQYYPPFTWSFLRINEVAYEVEEEGAQAGAQGGEREDAALVAAK